MKRAFIVLLLLVVILASVNYAAAETDLKSMSFDELLALRDQIIDEMLTRPEWTEVRVPAGVYEVGVDIPEGKWTITADPNGYFIVKIGNGINDSYTDFSGGLVAYELLTGTSSMFFDSSSTNSVTWNLTAGMYFISEGPTVFTIAVRPSLGF